MDVGASRTELDAFQILTNVDYVDWTRGRAAESSNVQVEVLESEDEESHDEHSVEKHPPQAHATHDSDDEDRHSHSSRDSGPQHQQQTKVDSLPFATTAAAAPSTPTPLSPYSATSSKGSSSGARMPPLPRSESPPEMRGPQPSPRSSFVHGGIPASPQDLPRRPMPKPRKYTAAEENEDYEVKAEKEALLAELRRLERTGIKLTRDWDVDKHTLDELQFEADRIASEENATVIVDYAKKGINFGVAGLEYLLKRQGFESVDGWHKRACSDMSKYNKPLNKIYKRYWRKTQMSPMTELAMLLLGSLGMTVALNKMGVRGDMGNMMGNMMSGMMGGGASASSSAAAPTATPGVAASTFEPPRPPPPPAGASAMRPPSAPPSVRPPTWSSAGAASVASAASAAPAATPTPSAAAAPANDANEKLMEMLSKMAAEQAKLSAKIDEQAREQKTKEEELEARIASLARSSSDRRSRSSRSTASASPRIVSLASSRKRVGTARRRAAASGSDVMSFE